jgi:hypothetical protein
MICWKKYSLFISKIAVINQILGKMHFQSGLPKTALAARKAKFS